MLVPRLALVIAVTSASPLIIERMSDEPGDYRFRSGAEAPKMHMEPVTHEEYHGILRRSDDLTHLHAKDEGELMYISNLEGNVIKLKSSPFLGVYVAFISVLGHLLKIYTIWKTDH
jgi:hypothetical protein